MRYPHTLLSLTAQTLFSNTIAFTFHGHSIPYNAPSLIQPSLVKPSSSYSVGVSSPSSSSSVLVRRAVPDDDDEDVNPYNDPNYPDLEFVNYDDPNYVVDQGITEGEFLPASVQPKEDDGTEEEIEAMREDRRRRNDEFQFETYHADVLKSGEAYKGEWTVYRTSTFLDGDNDDGNAPPQLRRERVNRKVVSVGKKIFLPETEGEFEFRVDGERIVNEERSATADDFEDGEEELDDIDAGSGDSYSLATVGRRFWPEKMSARDFRGDAGIMCVGNGYTICDTVPLSVGEAVAREEHDGPFAKMRTELGIQYKRMRFRIKLDYCVKGFGPNDSDTSDKDATTAFEGKYPALHLCSMVVCRETWERWPRYQEKNVDESDSDLLFGPPGAKGGLYDPPPVGSDEQGGQYMLLDLEGGATALFPYKIDQDPNTHSGNGWVTSLDWTPGRIRFQVDRKVMGGVKLRGLRTLELSEVEAESAEQWRPRDGGADMRR
eukprot:CAMPEP_0198249508 /NCGR_PEP_ID=MMETSP1447-20131203/1021_1 /TAXON_ID=420782 /ORGANISM="Chaetoceros dichaeta, Strain CCMP1751" /LENGTH=489 /DNA_ID=CAMNT_0043934165 /DNA_START=30 /DNA_END=1499 /DNA_ORIENTATION=+